jgi:hypothetical protein
MAKIYEEIVLVKLSKLIKHNEEEESLITDDTVLALEQVVQELVGDNIIVEVERA